MEKKITVIGAAVLDIFAGPIDKEIFTKGSVPAPNMEISCGGDALNESVFLSRLGMNTDIISLLGDDDASKTVLKCLGDNGVCVDRVTLSRSIPTGMNIVLVDEAGERYFVTNPKSSLRKLSKEHILPHIGSMGDIVSFASIFVSPKLPVSDMAEVFRRIKEKPGRILVADMTTAKNGERIKDLEPVLGYIDYIIPNEKEAALLTCESNLKKSAEAFIAHGAKNVIIKCGREGCIYDTGTDSGTVPAFLTEATDTTGAGDGFVSGFIYGLSKGLGITDCCRYGCAVASSVVECMGTQQVNITADEADRRFVAIDINCSNMRVYT